MKTAGLILSFVSFALVATVAAQPFVADSRIEGETIVLQGSGFGVYDFSATLGAPGQPVLLDGSSNSAPVEPPPAPNPQVVLGDNANYEDCEQRTSLTIQSWTDSEIVVEIAPADQTAGSVMYLFVVDELGEASLVGRAVQLPGQVEGPGQPGRPSVR